MNGYAKVSKQKILDALNNRNKKKDKALAIEKRAIKDCADDLRLRMNPIKRFFKKNYSDFNVVFGDKFWRYKPDILVDYISKSEYKLLDWFSSDSYMVAAALRNLCNASPDNEIILLDPQFCEYVVMNSKPWIDLND